MSDQEQPRPSKRPPPANEAPRPSKRPPENEAPRPSKRPPQQGPQRPQQGPQRPHGNEAPRPSKRPPPQGPQRPPQQGPQRPQGGDAQRPQGNDRPRPSRRPQGPSGGPQQGPAIPRPPRVPGDLPAAQGNGPRPPSRGPQGAGPSQRPQGHEGRRGPPQGAPTAQGPRPGAPRDGRPPQPERAPTQARLIREVREVDESPAPVAETTAPEPAPPRRLHLTLAGPDTVEPWSEPAFPDYEWGDASTLAAVAIARTAEAPRGFAVDAGNVILRRGDTVVLEGERGMELATITSPPRRQMVSARLPMRVLRKAGESDLRAEARLRVREAEAMRLAAKVAREMNLPAKVVRVECGITGGRNVVYLASEERLELRDVARALTNALRGRVEIRHVGVRDAAKNLGGVGPCGLQLCCNTFLSDFAPVSIRQAKDQGLALTPQRVSGVCGRLMCCLVYEDAFYRQQRALFPKHGKRVHTPKGEGRVRDVDVLARTVRVVFADGPMEVFSVDDVRPVFAPDGARREAGDDASEAPDGAPTE